jgi:hypothetical protein
MMNSRKPTKSPPLPRFNAGRIVATPGAIAVLKRYQIEPASLLERHICGDWGDVCPEDAQANELALRSGWRLLSAYVLTMPSDTEDLPSVKVWLITEADRRSTTFLLPEEY